MGLLPTRAGVGSIYPSTGVYISDNARPARTPARTGGRDAPDTARHPGLDPDACPRDDLPRGRRRPAALRLRRRHRAEPAPAGAGERIARRRPRDPPLPDPLPSGPRLRPRLPARSLGRTPDHGPCPRRRPQRRRPQSGRARPHPQALQPAALERAARSGAGRRCTRAPTRSPATSSVCGPSVTPTRPSPTASTTGLVLATDTVADPATAEFARGVELLLHEAWIDGAEEGRDDAASRRSRRVGLPGPHLRPAGRRARRRSRRRASSFSCT